MARSASTVVLIFEAATIASSSVTAMLGMVNGETGVPRRSRKPGYSCASRPGCRNTTLKPFRPALPARPQRCKKTFASLGGSIWTTRSTCGMSSPRAATSVVSRIAGEVELENRVKFLSRILGSCLPWRGTSMKDCLSLEGRIEGSTC